MNTLPIREVYLIKKDVHYDLIIYLDMRYGSIEMADELGRENSGLQKQLVEWVLHKYPKVKIHTIKVMLGTIVVGSMVLAPYVPSQVEAAAKSQMRMMSIDILINSKKLELKDRPFVISERTMIPIRDIAEALGATVTWDGKRNEVTVQLGDTRILLKIGSNTVYVNGTAKQSEIMTQIINARTYVPLRLVSEQLGAAVTWHQSTQTITIDKQIVQHALFVDAIHSYTPVDYKGDPTPYRSLQNSGLQVTSISTFAHQVQADGTIQAPYGVNQSALDFAENIGLPNYMLIHNLHGSTFTKEVLRKVLPDQAARSKLIDEILLNIERYNYDGVEVDFEGIGSEDRGHFTTFLQELKEALASLDLTLMIAVPAKVWDDPKNSWSGGYDYAAIGEIVDGVMIMSYDEHWSGGPPGPVSSLPWYKQVAAYVERTIPKEKVLMGIPLYGYDWPESGKTRALFPVGIESIIAKYGGMAQLDPVSETPFYRYTDDKGIKHQIWFEDNESIAKKIKVVQEYGFKGVGLWRLGFEKQELWHVLQARDKQNS